MHMWVYLLPSWTGSLSPAHRDAGEKLRWHHSCCVEYGLPNPR